MYLFIEKELRGEFSYATKRYRGPNNKYMKNYDPTKPWKYISYLDMSNLHGSAMSGYHPYGEFKWLKNSFNFDVNSNTENSPIGYILEVDQEYRDELHEPHNDYPLAPEKFEILYDML